jgi:hypothetical protein
MLLLYQELISSAVFESMKEIPAPVGDESTSPSTIQIDHPAAIIEIFLDLASVSQPNLAPIYLAQCRDLLVFVEQFDCRVLTHKVRLRLCELVESAEDCAEVFVAASDRDDWVMGRAALGRVRSSVVYHIRARSVTGIKTYFDRLRPSWRQKMVELVLFPLAQGTAKSYDWDWSLYAPDFQRPATPPEKRKRRYVERADPGAIGWVVND